LRVVVLGRICKLIRRYLSCVVIDVYRVCFIATWVEGSANMAAAIIKRFVVLYFVMW
jgi:hypothetical protein